ncbi:MAG: type II toxin-antitoxin system VapC family toxin [Acidobacteriota bacterium]
MSLYVADTNALIYHTTNRSRLSKRALAAFESAEQNQALIYIPAPALWEVSNLEKAGHINLRLPFQKWLNELLAQNGFDVVPLDAEIISEARSYGFNDDIFDAAIVATAKVKDLPLITRDTAIITSGIVEICW